MTDRHSDLQGGPVGRNDRPAPNHPTDRPAVLMGAVATLATPYLLWLGTGRVLPFLGGALLAATVGLVTYALVRGIRRAGATLDRELQDPTERCPCGQPLHYTNPQREQQIRELVATLGPDVQVTTPAGSWRVPRHFIALHGLTAAELPLTAAILGFPKVDQP